MLLLSSTARQTAQAPRHTASILDQTSQEAKWQVIIFHSNGFYQGFCHSLSKVCKGRVHPHRIQCYKNSELSCSALSCLCLFMNMSCLCLLAKGSTDPTPHSTWWSLVASKCLWNPVKSQRSQSSFYWYSHSYFLSFRTENKSTLLDAIWTLLIIYSNKFSYQHLIKCFLVLLIGGKSEENDNWLIMKSINSQNTSYEPYAI